MKRKWRSAAVRVVFVLFVFAGLIILSGADPVKAGKQFFSGIFGNLNGFAEVFVRATPLIFLSLGVSLSFKTGFFNLGAEGQLYMGAWAAMIAVMLTENLPAKLRIVICFIAAFLAGGVFALIPALMKNRMGISETISTIMLNYIAIMIVGIAIRGSLHDAATTQPQSFAIPKEMRLTQILYPTRLHTGLIVAVVCAVAIWILMYKTPLGFEMRMTGLSRRASLVNGLPVGKSIVLSAVIAGGLSGLAGVNEVLGVQYKLLEGISSGNGYTAVLIALLAKNHPLWAVAAAVGYSAVYVGATTMQRRVGVPSSIVSIVLGLIVLMILCENISTLFEGFRRKEK